MKKLLGMVMVLGLVLGLGRVAMAGDTATLNVSATVNGTCKFSALNASLTLANDGLGAIDPSVNTAATGSTTIAYRCTKGTPATGVTAGNGDHFSGNRRVGLGDHSDYMAYSLTLSGGTQTGTGFGAGQDKTLDISGTILVADFQNATAGVYDDHVTLTITP